MKNMRYLLLLLCTGCLSTMAQDNIGHPNVLFQESDIRLINDSVHVSFLMDVDHFKVLPSRQLVLTPVLKYGDQWDDLPPVIIMGRKRAAYARREEALGEGMYLTPPYTVLVKDKKQEMETIVYNIGIPYQSSMNHLQLWLRQTDKSCCDERFLHLGKLSGDIALQTNTPLVPEKPTLLAPVALPNGIIVNYITPEVERVKQRNACDTVYIGYRQGRYAVDPRYENNSIELNRIENLLSPLLTDGMSTIKSIHIAGFASPEGNYADNDLLSKRRSEGFADYLCRTYRIRRDLMQVTWMAEDWEGLTDLLSVSPKSYKGQVLGIIRDYSIFQGREKVLMDLEGGRIYNELLNELFPKLRRIVLQTNYEVRRVSDVEASSLVYARPQQLSLEEIFRVACFFKPGSAAYREVYEIAARQYPDNIIANINAGAASLIGGDTKAAGYYLSKVKENPRASNNLGVLAMLEGRYDDAKTYFEKAMQVEAEIAKRNLMIWENLR